MKKRFLTLSLVFGLIFSSVPVYAENIEINTSGTQSTVVTATKESSFSVRIPKTITLVKQGETSTYACDYEISTTGDIAGDEVLSVVPDSSVTLSSTGKADITATVTQEVTEWDYIDIASKVANGNISVNDVKAGSWTGDLNFDISLETETIQYTPFTLTANNYTQTGITSLEGDVVIPETFEYDGVNYKVTGIGDSAFYNCSNLTNITIPDSVTNIGNGAFYKCSNLTNITIPDSITNIDTYTFNNCSNLTSIEIPDSVISIGERAFAGSGLESVIIPDSVTNIGNGAFDCNNLTDVYFTGTEEQWNIITIEGGNACLTDATIHYNYTE